MPILTGSQSEVWYTPETVFGTTPATPTWEQVCYISSTLGLTKDSIEKGCLNSTRQVEDSRHGNKQVGGDIVGELDYGNFDDLIEAAMLGTWTANVLEVGTTFRSFTIERKFLNLTVPEFHRTTGDIINTMAVSVQPNAMVGLTFGVIGKDLDPATAEVAGSVYSAMTERPPFDSFTGTFNEGGSPSAVITGVDFTLENGYEAAFVLGSDTTIQPSDGKCRVTGTLTYFYESKAIYDKFINETESSIDFTLIDQDGNSMQFEFPNIQYNGGNPDISDEGQVTVTAEFQALYDQAEGTTLKITRTPV